MTVYIDGDYKCHASSGEGLTAVETAFFDGKCQALIEGYRFIPEGQTWTRADGEVFNGEMLSPCMEYAALAAAQSMYEAEEAAHTQEIAELVELIYEADLEVIG